MLNFLKKNKIKKDNEILYNTSENNINSFITDIKNSIKIINPFPLSMFIDNNNLEYQKFIFVYFEINVLKTNSLSIDLINAFYKAEITIEENSDFYSYKFLLTMSEIDKMMLNDNLILYIETNGLNKLYETIYNYINPYFTSIKNDYETNYDQTKSINLRISFESIDDSCIEVTLNKKMTLYFLYRLESDNINDCILYNNKYICLSQKKPNNINIINYSNQYTNELIDYQMSDTPLSIEQILEMYPDYII